ncbi:MAG: hypothetical protein HY319_07445 [Armatimonadetes bacterium]|nr:hypothetical protein [Armatimonadota bacterium]
MSEQALPPATPGVLETTRAVVEAARDVRIDHQAIERLADAWVEHPLPDWDTAVHWNDGSWRTTNYVLLLDALNFCFWPDEGEPKWGIHYGGKDLNGYRALAAALRRAVEEGRPLYDAGYLAALELGELQQIFRGRGSIPMPERRLENVREVGRVLGERWDGRFSAAVEEASGSAVALVGILERDFPSFRDIAEYDGRPVRLLKRAQITAVDLVGTFGAEGWGRFHDADRLTAFADYKIPQVLRARGVLAYSQRLADTVDRRTLIPAGEPREVEIRAAMIWAVEWIRQSLAARGAAHRAYEIDWMLWNQGQRPLAGERPYHRTRTIFY